MSFDVVDAGVGRGLRLGGGGEALTLSSASSQGGAKIAETAGSRHGREVYRFV